MTTLLLQAVRDTLGTLLADPQYLGAQPGLAALHWSQTLVLHPHVHCLVTGSELTPAGQWVAVRHGFLLPVRVVMAVFRGEDGGRDPADFGAWGVSPARADGAQQVLNLLNRPQATEEDKWNVRIMERYRHGAGVVTYLARYLRGGPIKNARLVAFDGARVTFLHRTRQEGTAAPQRITLPVADFLQRWLLHVPYPRRGPCGALGCTMRRGLRRWLCAARRSGSRRRWSGGVGLADGVCPAWGGHLSGVPPVASGSCVQASSRGEEHLPAWHQRSAPHEIRITGEPCQGVVCLVAARGRGTEAPKRARGGQGATHGHRSFQCGAGRACHRPHNGDFPMETP